MPESPIGPEDVLDFWFEELSEEGWFGGGKALDERIRDRFGALHEAVAKDFPDSWLATREGLLAGILVLDQFSRNIHRGTARAYAADTDALNLANLAIERGWAEDYGPRERQFLHMPFMHAEDMRAQNEAVALFERLGLEEPADFARRHRDVIARFGRFPARNEALDRETTAEEQAYLDEGGGF